MEGWPGVKGDGRAAERVAGTQGAFLLAKSKRRRTPNCKALHVRQLIRIVFFRCRTLPTKRVDLFPKS